jgi:hypothetical protein
MKKILLTGAMILVLRGGVLLGQEVQKPYSYILANGIGDCTFTGVSLDEVWGALVKTFMTQNTKGKGGHFVRSPVNVDRPLNSMIGTWIGSANWHTQPCTLQILVEQRPEGIGVYGTVASNPNSTKKSREKVMKAFFDKVAELLYPVAKG